MNYALAGTFILTGFLSGATGRSAALHFSQKYGRVSILVFMLTLILCASVILLVYEIGSKELDWDLHSLC